MTTKRARVDALKRLGRVCVAIGMMVAITGLASTAAGGAEQGNNGTIKVDEQGLENGPGAPNSNDPHIDCVGRVEWYGFDTGVQSADVLFEVQAPTSSTGAPGAPTSKSYSDVPVVDGDGPGGTSLDGILDYDLSDVLSFYAAHPQQGFHVKVTVHTTFAQGSDVKHKVFWVDPCPVAGPGPVVVTPPVITPPSVTPPVVAPEVVERPVVQPDVIERPVVQPAVIEQPVSPPTEVAGVVIPRQLPRTGETAVPLLQIGLGLILLGAGATLFGSERIAPG